MGFVTPGLQRWIRRLTFRLWYLTRPPWDTNQTPPELIEFVERGRAPGRALDLGCGTGTNVVYLARHGWQATGVDFAPRAVELARRKARAAGVTVDLRVGDVTKLDDLAGPFDLLFDQGCFHSLTPDQRRAAAAQMARLTRPGSVLLLYAFHPVPGQSLGLTKDEMIALVSPAFRLVKFEEGKGRPSAWYTFGRLDTGIAESPKH